jgi:hypothetical protein
MHFVKTGGFNGHIEYYERMVARIIPFRKRFIIQSSPHNYNSFLNLRKLEEFNKPEFIDKVNTICADSAAFKHRNVKKNSIVSEMFQLDLLLLLPGQELPMHLNVPYFWQADRNTFPQWLLVLMKRSKLFNNMFIPQVQGMNWLNLDEKFVLPEGDYVDLNGDGGDFYFYPYLPNFFKDSESGKEHKTYENVEKYIILKSKPNSVILLDGAQVIHGIDRYKPNQHPPLYSHSHQYTIKFDKKTQLWYLYDLESTLLTTYYKEEPKLMVVWNAHCFANEAERVKFHDYDKRQELSLEQVIKVFKDDLRERSRLPSESIEPLDLWTIALKEYLKYPVNTHQQNSTIFGINYCLLPNIVPKWFTEKFLKLFLSKRC